MTNRAIANAFDELANLMELHEEDDFRIRTYRNAYITLRKVERPLAELSDSEIKGIKGVGNAIAAKIKELVQAGRMETLERYRQLTPPGVVEMLEINGFGPKKVRTVWKELEIETPGELWYACNENRLVELKGFGAKTQADLKSKLEFFQKSRNKFHFHAAEEDADFASTWIIGKLPGAVVFPVGDVRRQMPVVERIELLVAYSGELTPIFDGETMTLIEQMGTGYKVRLESNTELDIFQCEPSRLGTELVRLTGNPEYLNALEEKSPGILARPFATEAEVFETAGLPFVVPERRESAAAINDTTELIQLSQIRGALHLHTTWSDGIHSLKEMAEYAASIGFQYLGVTDHSQSAFYANGLKSDRVLQQMEEIDALNAAMAPFRIFKGIESDILYDGNLDYEPAILEKFDFIIASIHSQLNMPRQKATDRLVRAIENPFTTIIGHPTGRLLLSRNGYEVDWDAVFDACARNGVVLELNANPYRLDLDYTLIPEARKRGIQIAINSDAHSKEGLHDVRFGVNTARKGGLTADGCLNSLTLEEFEAFIGKNKKS